MASKRKSPTREKPPASTATSRVTILLEAIEQQNRATIEAVFSTRNELRSEFNEKFERLDYRMSVLEVVARQHTSILEQHGERLSSLEKNVVAIQRDVTDLRTDVTALQIDVRGLRTDVTALQIDVRGLRTDVTALQKDMVTLQRDVRHLTDVVEAKADKVRVDRLEERVTALEGRLDA